jgi:FdhE protein
VRIKCRLRGSTEGIAHEGIDGDADIAKPETCDRCRADVKILYPQREPAVDPLAVDVATVALDLLVSEVGHARGAFNRFLLGY